MYTLDHDTANGRRFGLRFVLQTPAKKDCLRADVIALLGRTGHAEVVVTTLTKRRI